MKYCNWLIVIVSLVFVNLNYAQISYYSMTAEGGEYGIGAITKADMNGENPEVVYDFKTDYVGQNSRYVQLVELEDGYLYGTTGSGGKFSKGTLFRYNPVTKDYNALHSFNGDDGQRPRGGIIQAKDGMIYGMCNQGGVMDLGIVFRYNLQTDQFTKLYDLSDQNCANPYSKLFQHNNGKIYGISSAGGTAKRGAMFEFDPTSLDFKLIHSFTDATGRAPTGSVIAVDDVLYGMATFGGTNKAGEIFTYDLSSNTYAQVAAFDNKNGRAPRGNLTMMKNGKMYGITNQGGKYNLGAMFEFDPVTNQITHKDDFSNIRGYAPFGDLVIKDDNTMIGLTSKGGLLAAGSIFNFNIQADSLYIMKYFAYRNGLTAEGSPTITKNGKIYGVTRDGGFNNQGVIFEYDESRDSILVEVNFNHAKDGSNPCGSLLQASDGQVYGVASFGGDKTSFGVAFMLDPKTDEYTKLADFDQSNGAFPYGSFVEGDDRVLYGLTWAGGDSTQSGAIIALDTKNGELTTPATLQFRNGGRPYANLTRAENGRFYGMTSLGGENNQGVIFEFRTDRDTIEVLHNFHPQDKMGYIPYGSLTSDGKGNLYGMTFRGGASNNGCIFKFQYKTNTYELLESFGGRISGASPTGNLLLHNNKLYGMNTVKSDFRGGAIFELDIATNKYKKVFAFDADDGRGSGGSLVLTNDNKILGYSTNGGANDAGTAFVFDPAVRNSFKKVWDFDYEFGSKPIYGSPAYVDATITAIDLPICTFKPELMIYPNPASTDISIMGLDKDEIILQVDCYNMDGKLVLSRSSNERKLDVSNFNIGSYVLKILTNEGDKIMKFVVE